MGSQPERFPDYIVPWLIIGFEFLAVVCLVLMLRYADTRLADDCVADADLQPWHLFLRRNIKLFGIVPFYFAIFVFDIFRLNAELKCVDVWTALCANGDVRVEHITDLVYPVARVIYLLFELIVCVKFNASNFYQNTLVLAGLAVVQATNLSAWLDALVDESVVFSSHRNSTYELSRCFNETIANISEHFVQCFRRTTGEYDLLEAASPYLYPFIVEYLMLVTECVADWFFSDAEQHHGIPAPTVQLAPPSRPTSGTQFDVGMRNAGSSGQPNTSYGSMNVEQQSPQGASADISRASSSNSVFQFDAGDRQGENMRLLGAVPSNDAIPSTSTVDGPAGFVHVDAVDGVLPETWCDRCPWFFVSVILSSIASFLFVIFGIFNLFLGEVGYLNVFMFYRICYWLALSMAALVGYVASRRFPSCSMNPNGFEYFVIFSCIGPILQSIFTMVANVRMDIFRIFLTEEITNILQICTQAVFYAYAKSIQIRTDGDNVTSDFELRRKRSILTGVLSYFAVCNFALWVEDSFIETRSSETSWQRQYFDNWPLIYNIFNPLSLVFRFNSVFLFLNVLFDKRR